VDNTETITVLSLCTGYGGLELGLSRALQNPMRVVAVEVEAYALANLVAKAEEGELAIEALWPDLRTFPKERFRGCFDIITAGYPCQPFSCAGKRQGESDPRHLWPYIAGIVQAVRPVWCFFENVSGHLTLGFPEVYRSLRDMGYSVETELFTAAECGAPHRRERLFILGYSQSNGYITPKVKRGTKETVSNNQKGQNTTRQKPQGFQRNTQRWPARPGQPQYEWEEPRVVANAKSSQSRQGKPQQEAERQNEWSITGKDRTVGAQGQAQSRLGRAVDGSSSRVDRLRLLGNGVVPQQAEKAFRYLMEKF